MENSYHKLLQTSWPFLTQNPKLGLYLLYRLAPKHTEGRLLVTPKHFFQAWKLDLRIYLRLENLLWMPIYSTLTITHFNFAKNEIFFKKHLKIYFYIIGNLHHTTVNFGWLSDVLPAEDRHGIAMKWISSISKCYCL